MRRSLLIWLFVELLLAVALGQIGHSDSPAMARAFLEWRQHPSSETSKEFERQKRITELERWGLSGVVFAALGGATIFVFWLRRGEPGTPGNSQSAAQLTSL